MVPSKIKIESFAKRCHMGTLGGKGLKKLWKTYIEHLHLLDTAETGALGPKGLLVCEYPLGMLFELLGGEGVRYDDSVIVLAALPSQRFWRPGEQPAEKRFTWRAKRESSLNQIMTLSQYQME